MAKLTKQDIMNATNVQKLLRRGKFELEGDEAIVFASLFGWLDTIRVRAEEDFKEEERKAKEKADAETQAKELESLKQEADNKLAEVKAKLADS